MLYILTGNIQIGKTRWLQRLVKELEGHGVRSYGVLAPGVWQESSSEHADANGFEKLGIDNLLLPDQMLVRFADRRDLAMRAGTYSEYAQSARSKLGWHIYDSAIDEVNAHLSTLANRASSSGQPGLLVIDELGRLEIMAGEGLTEAMKLLEAGPQCGIENALVIARIDFFEQVEQRFGTAWDGACGISPDEATLSQLIEKLAR